MYSMKAVPVATFNETGPAQQLRDRFLRAGIQTRIRDESKLERFWFMSEPLAAIHVEVDQPDFLNARRLIHEWDSSEGVLKDAVFCPSCRSSRVEFPQITRKFAMPVVAAILMASHLIRRRYYCMDCHFTWPKVEPVKRELDPLGWPYDSKFWHPERAAKRNKAGSTRT